MKKRVLYVSFFVQRDAVSEFLEAAGYEVIIPNMKEIAVMAESFDGKPIAKKLEDLCKEHEATMLTIPLYFGEGGISMAGTEVLKELRLTNVLRIKVSQIDKDSELNHRDRYFGFHASINEGKFLVDSDYRQKVIGDINDLFQDWQDSGNPLISQFQQQTGRYEV